MPRPGNSPLHLGILPVPRPVLRLRQRELRRRRRRPQEVPTSLRSFSRRLIYDPAVFPVQWRPITSRKDP